MSQAPVTIALALISHTNAGKTALARTLLGRDVGEVRDAAHVTADATEHVMIATPAGEQLVLWDTPGFGDSTRLARRLALHGNPLGWFLAQVWDRFRERPLWLAQKAMATVRDRADVVLYLVNCSEDPADAGYLDAELKVLAWAAKPVVALLNQTGRARPREEEAAEEARWRNALAPCQLVRAVLTLDAFARCWPQETVLLDVVAGALVGDAHAAAQRLRLAWVARRRAQFDEAMCLLAAPMVAAAVAQAELPAAGWRDTWRRLGRVVGLGGRNEATAAARAMQGCADDLDRDVRASTDALIALHGLDGRAADEVMARLASDVVTEAPASEGRAAVVGGVLSGALSGLAADLAAGGLTLGAGVLAGGIAGALGGAGLARGYNIVRGTTATTVRWSAAFLDMLVTGALLRYLAVAHHGRGRGAWIAPAIPGFWRERSIAAQALHAAEWTALWQARASVPRESLDARLRALLAATGRDLLAALYPEADLGDGSVSATTPASAQQGLP